MRRTAPTTSPRCCFAEWRPSKWRSSWRCSTSATSVDLPEPDTPVTTVNVPTGMLTVRSARLCAVAPSIVTQRGPARRPPDPLRPREVGAGEGRRGAHPLDRPLEDPGASVPAGAGAQLDEPVGG